MQAQISRRFRRILDELADHKDRVRMPRVQHPLPIGGVISGTLPLTYLKLFEH